VPPTTTTDAAAAFERALRFVRRRGEEVARRAEPLAWVDRLGFTPVGRLRTYDREAPAEG
jgi:hypothetical protein